VVLGALRSTGDVIFPVSAAITSLILVLGVGSVILGQRYGLVGIWIAYAADEWIRGALMFSGAGRRMAGSRTRGRSSSGCDRRASKAGSDRVHARRSGQRDTCFRRFLQT